MPPDRLGYLVVSLLCFVAGAVGFELLFPSSGGSGSIVSFLVLYAPFAVLALLAASLEAETSRRLGAVFFGVFVCVLGWLYFRAYAYSETALAQRKWTAATLSIGFLVFKSVLVLAVAGGVGFLIKELNSRITEDES